MCQCYCYALNNKCALFSPFVAFVTLDGIDVREEFQVLHWQQLVSARNNIFPEGKLSSSTGCSMHDYIIRTNKPNPTSDQAMPYGGRSTFFTGEIMIGDIESSVPVYSTSSGPKSQNDAETPLGNASEATHASRRRRHRARLPSLGDASFLAGLDGDVEYYRESGYQLCGRTKRDLSNAATPPRVVSVGNKDEEDQRPSSC